MTSSSLLYRWHGTDANGTPVSGQTPGRSPAYVRAGLIRQGITVASLRPASGLAFSLPKRREKADPAGFSRQLATLLKAGVPLLQAFEVMGRSGCNAAQAALLERLKQDVASGLGLADALQRHPAWFDALYCNLVRVGEQSGTLDRQLEQLAGMLEQRRVLHKKVRKAMIYPLLLLLTGLGVSAILLLEVIPKFESMFSGMGAALPAFTQWVINLSTGLSRFAPLLLVMGLMLGVAVRQLYRQHAPARLWISGRVLGLPVFGKLLGQAALARFARSLATSYGAGVPLLDALGTVARVTGGDLHEQAVLRLRQGMANGQGLNQAMAGEPLFPPLLVQLTAIGESSGTLDQMLEKAASHYEEQVSQALDQLTSLLEPAIVLILGLLVGGLVVAMYLPIFQLGSLI
ncbi:type II secretion system F family protein [Pseudomonas putida]|uniref:type II secretion system F family protein n=1 Tax=Pseudomonas TaxID=286 RepID=UPI001376B2CE|nr:MULTISPECIES: type II secretion system F family protein [Pseudomonas]MDH1693760.1 type II secretion system F family protein [Pseudomonas sp. GD03766]NBA81903.1 type II secretion system F family protein [Pseudomonas putida]UFH27701.1 type II secretion system F family protein [Pseudomonas sp. CIP-10]